MSSYCSSSKALNVREVQLHDPILVTSSANSLQSQVERTYSTLAGVGLPMQLVTYFDDLGDAYGWGNLAAGGGHQPGLLREARTWSLVKAYGFPADKNPGGGRCRWPQWSGRFALKQS